MYLALFLTAKYIGTIQYINFANLENLKPQTSNFHFPLVILSDVSNKPQINHNN